MGKFWKLWFLSGEAGRYVDIDFNFWFVRGHLHVQYGSTDVQVLRIAPDFIAWMAAVTTQLGKVCR